MLSPEGRVIWITGLSGAGKTTLARALLPHLPQPRLLLDGDEMREALNLLAGGYEAESRKRLAYTYSRLCKLAADQETTVVCATISMFHEVRKWNRLHLPGYFEVYLEASDEVRKCRDHKRVYHDAPGPVVGRSIQPELPLHPDLCFQQGGLAVETMVDKLISILQGGTGMAVAPSDQETL